MLLTQILITFPEEENEVTTVLKKSTYFLHDIYNWNNGNSNGTKIPTTATDQSSETSEKEENGEIIEEEEIFYIKKLIRNIVEIFVWTKKSISRILKRSTRVALSAPKTLVLLLVPSILSQHNINAESLNGISTFPHGKKKI